MITKTRKELGEILGVKISRNPRTGCWFVNKQDHSNYSQIHGKPGHRVIYELCVGPIIPGRIICHKCDVPGCVCPGHLFQGTYSDNIQDARNKGRSTYGRYKPSKKLTEEDKRLKLIHHLKQLVRFCG